MVKKKIIRKSNRTLNLFVDGGDTTNDVTTDVIGGATGGPSVGVATKPTWRQQAKAASQEAFSNENLGSTIGTLASGVGSIVGAGIANSQTADTSSLEGRIKQAQTYTVQANNNDDLMNEWATFSPMEHVSWRDIMGTSTGQRIGNTLGGTGSGALTGALVGGPIGAIIGGGLGLIGGLFGGLAARNRAKRKARKFNRQIDAANVKNLAALNDKARSIDTQNDLNMLANFSAYGGPINIFGNGAIDYELTKEDLYNKQLNAMSKYKLSSMPNSFEVPKIDTFADGGRIYIKPENRGKFTALKQRTGKSATWFKEHGTPAQKKMATFALNAKKWKHELGGNLYKDGGSEDKKIKRIDFSTYKPLFDRGFIPENMEQLQDSLINRGYNDAQRLAIMANVLHESGGDPKAVDSSGKYKGLIQWGPDRYPNTEDLGEQIHKLIEEANTASSPAWSDGGGGIPFIKDLQQGYDNFWESEDPYDATLYYTKGSVRPKEEKARINRAEEARNMFKNLKANGGSLLAQYTPQLNKNPKYMQGSIYDVTGEEIKILKELGYEFEYV